MNKGKQDICKTYKRLWILNLYLDSSVFLLILIICHRLTDTVGRRWQIKTSSIKDRIKSIIDSLKNITKIEKMLWKATDHWDKLYREWGKLWLANMLTVVFKVRLLQYKSMWVFRFLILTSNPFPYILFNVITMSALRALVR